MIKNFITIALRQFRRNFVYTAINVVGLALGLAGSFVIGSWVWQELSYDKHFAHSEDIYRASVSFYNSGAFASGPEVLNNTLQELAPEVEQTTRLSKESSTPVYIGERSFEEYIFYADSNFFEVFSYPFVAGSSEALSHPNQLVIDTQLANKWFGTTDVVGKSVEIGEEKMSYLIAGVVQSTDKPSHINAHIWLPMQLKGSDNWTSAYTHNYIQLAEGFSQDDLKTRLESIKEELVYPKFRSEVPYDEWLESNLFDFHIVALEEIYLDTDMRFEMQPGGNKANVYIFLIVAICLVVIAIINFVNLSTAQAINRAKEVGIRKTLGTGRRTLIAQFLAESMVLSFLAMLVGVGVAEIFLILFQTFTSEVLINGIFTGTTAIVMYILLGAVVGILAGIYPAFYLSQFHPSSILKSSSPETVGKQAFRNVLVVIQFTVSITLIIGSLFVFKQLEFLRNVDIGFDRENVLIIENAEALGDSKTSFKSMLRAHSGIEGVSFNKRMPAGNSVWIYVFKSEAMEKDLSFQTFMGDEDFLPTMGFNLLEGRNFSKDLASDSLALILNESAAKEMLLDNPVGAKLQDGFHVIGVVSDFSYQSFQDKPGPVVLMFNPDGYKLSVKTKEGQAASVLEFVNSQWKTLGIEEPLNYSFLDENFEKLMEKEKTLSKTVSFFTAIAIFISCMGLFGLAAYTAQQKRKEIGIRKVLGASIADVLLLLNRKFTGQVIIAVLIAIPIASYMLDKWLQNFTYKVNISWWLFVLSGITALLIAWLTVSYLSYRAANANPVDSLRDE